MKKMLFIGAMLIVGMTTFAGKSADLGTASGNMNGDTTLGITTRGEVVDTTGKVVLVVKPTLNGGSDGGSIEFAFGDMEQGSSKQLPGEFTVEVLKENTPVSLGSGNELAVKIYNGDKEYDGTPVQLNKTNTQDKVGTLSYVLTGNKENENKKYIGRVTAIVKLEDTANGAFSNKDYHAKITLTKLTVN